MTDKSEKAEKVASPVYFQIALDIAARIMNGELPEDTKLYGRSVMSSEYSVSPETIRKSLKLLSDMEVVQIYPNSGAVVKSEEKAREYVKRFTEQSETQNLEKQLRQMVLEHIELTRRIQETVSRIVKTAERFSRTNPLHNYEAVVSPESSVEGKTLAELQFWQKTGATVIAVRRDGKMILSPGPYIQLLSGDSIIFIGDPNTVSTVYSLLQP